MENTTTAETATVHDRVILKPGREVLDPHNRRIEVVSVTPDPSGDKARDVVTCRLRGPYGATVTYTRSMLRPVE